MKEALPQAMKVIDKDLCDHCLGRLFAHIGTGTTNERRGRELRVLIDDELAKDGRSYVHERCWLCDDIFDLIPRFADAVMERLAAADVEFDNFLVGTRVDPAIQAKEEEIWSVVGQEKAEPIKSEMNREIGKVIEARTGKGAEFSNPQVVALVDTRFAHVELEIAPLFIYGRYLKLSREIPQSKWPCRACQGKGCPRCSGTGKMYQTSVQELLGDIVLKYSRGTEHFIHGMGREDIDAVMVGTGRPFVLEVRGPLRRELDLGAIEREANEASTDLAGFLGLRYSSREEVRRIKEATPEKEYRVRVGLHGKVNKDKVNEVVRTFDNTRISQHTPVRVQHRRADLKRERTVIYVVLESFDGEEMTLRVRAESGTYIKELVHGDGGRTRPSISELLSMPLTVESLDVIGIIDNEG